MIKCSSGCELGRFFIKGHNLYLELKTKMDTEILIHLLNLNVPKYQFYFSHVMRKPVYAICKQQRHRSACTFPQSDQRLCCSLPG